MEEELRIAARESIEKKAKEEPNPDAYTKESRVQIYKEMQE